MTGATTPTALVMPLYWNSSTSEYMIQFSVGASNVRAAFDTGSAKLVVATAPSQSVSGTYADITKLKPVAAALNSTAPCTFTQSYGSQSVQVNVLNGSVTFPRSSMDLTQLCASDVITALTSVTSASPVIVPNFPVNGIVNVLSSSGQRSINVFGMSAVQTTTRTSSGGFSTPACQTVPTAVYESQLLQDLSTYYAKQNQDFIWKLMLGNHVSSVTQACGFAAFGAINVPCLRPQYTALIPVLPNATTPLTLTPFRYYVVKVVSCTIVTSSGSSRVLSDFPNYLMLDSGTTDVSLPGTSWSALNALQGTDSAQLVLAALPNSKPVTIVWTAADTRWENNPTFNPIDSGLLSELSSKQDVGILGSTGMRNLFLEFNLTQNTVGFAQIVN